MANKMIDEQSQNLNGRKNKLYVVRSMGEGSGLSPDREAGSPNKETQMSQTLAEKYKQQLAARTEEQETVSPLWEQPPYNECDLIHRDGELAVQLEDRSVYSYESGEAYTAAEWTLKKMMEEPPTKQEITMVYLDEAGTLQSVTLPIEGDGPTEDDWFKLQEQAEMESFRVFEVLSIDGSDGRVIIADGPVVVGTPDDGTLLEALRLAGGKQEYYFSSRH